MAQLIPPAMESDDLSSAGPQGRRRELTFWSYPLTSTSMLWYAPIAPTCTHHTEHCRQVTDRRQYGWKGEFTSVGKKVLGVIDVVILSWCWFPRCVHWNVHLLYYIHMYVAYINCTEEREEEKAVFVQDTVTTAQHNLQVSCSPDNPSISCVSMDGSRWLV